MVFRHGKSNSDIHLMIQGFCVTLILQIGVSEAPGSCFKAPPGPYLRFYCVYIGLQPSFFMVLGHVETDFDIYLIIQEVYMTLMLPIGVSETPWRLLQSPSWSIFLVAS